jgi:predicted DCC family thiol-disulfide oxidoreductase YuxK
VTWLSFLIPPLLCLVIRGERVSTFFSHSSLDALDVLVLLCLWWSFSHCNFVVVVVVVAAAVVITNKPVAASTMTALLQRRCFLLWMMIVVTALSSGCALLSRTATTSTRHLVGPRTASVSPTTTTAIPPTTTTYDKDVILYDGVCNFCNTWVDILLRIDRQGKFRFAPLQSTVGQALLVTMVGTTADDISSVVLVKARTGESFTKSACVLQVVQELGPVAAWASRAALAAVPADLRDGIYDTVAENRYKLLGKREECRCTDPQFADRFLLD